MGTLIARLEDRLLDRYLDTLDCRGTCDACEASECCGDECLDVEDHFDWEREAELRAEWKAERDDR